MKALSFAIFTIAGVFVVCGLIQMSKGEQIGYKILGLGIILGFIHTWTMLNRTNRGK
jgi:hypothetical protein